MTPQSAPPYHHPTLLSQSVVAQQVCHTLQVASLFLKSRALPQTSYLAAKLV